LVISFSMWIAFISSLNPTLYNVDEVDMIWGEQKICNLANKAKKDITHANLLFGNICRWLIPSTQ